MQDPGSDEQEQRLLGCIFSPRQPNPLSVDLHYLRAVLDLHEP